MNGSSFRRMRIKIKGLDTLDFVVATTKDLELPITLNGGFLYLFLSG